MLCTEIVSDIQNKFCTEHVLPMFFKKKSFWERFTCNSSTVHNDHDIGNIILKIKKTLEIEMWKICRLQSPNGEKQADKRPIPKTKTVYRLSKILVFPGCMASQWFLEPPKIVGDYKINYKNIWNNKTSPFYCWLYFPTSIVHILDYLLTPERYTCQQNI